MINKTKTSLISKQKWHEGLLFDYINEDINIWYGTDRLISQ